jgi:PEP-CTERM motif
METVKIVIRSVSIALVCLFVVAVSSAYADSLGTGRRNEINSTFTTSTSHVGIVDYAHHDGFTTTHVTTFDLAPGAELRFGSRFGEEPVADGMRFGHRLFFNRYGGTWGEGGSWCWGSNSSNPPGGNMASPEPGTLLLLGSGLSGLFFRRRRATNA